MNKLFFDIDTNEKYYVLGWILSDGHVAKNKKFWTIKIQAKDRLMLQKIQQIIEHSGNIYGPYKDDNQVQLQINNKEHLAFLTQSWELDNHKSSTLKWKDVSDEFLPHLVRGYFDGDGSIFTKQSNNPNVNTVGINFVGTHHFINGLQKAINQANNLSENSGHISDLDTWACLCYNGGDQALKILDWMYVNSAELTRLDRKFEKYINYKIYIADKIKYDLNNNSARYESTITPDYQMAQKIRFDYENLSYTIKELSTKYNVNATVIHPIIQNITHIRIDNRSNHATFDITAFGETHHILDWVDDDRCNVDLGTLRDRILNQKLDPEEALTKFPDSTSGTLKYKYEIDGEEKTISEILKDKKISRAAFTHRIHNLGIDPKEASEKLPGEVPHVNHAPDKLSNNQRYTIQQVEEARSMHQSGQTVKQISQILDMTETALYDIVRGKSFENKEYIPLVKKSDTICITWNGESQTIQQWSDELDIKYNTLDRRYRDFQNPTGKIKSLDQVFYNGDGRLDLGKAKSERENKGEEIAAKVRNLYHSGKREKEICELLGIKDSKYSDIIGNRTFKVNPENIWWKL